MKAIMKPVKGNAVGFDTETCICSIMAVYRCIRRYVQKHVRSVKEVAVLPRCFNERVATQVAAFFLKAAGETIPDYIKLAKLMYLADRKALLRLGFTLTKGTHFSLPKGPVVGEVNDLLSQSGRYEGTGFWEDHVRREGKYVVKLVKDPGTSLLGTPHLKVLEDIQAEHGGKEKWELVEYCEALPEHRKPRGAKKSQSISYIRILCREGRSQDEATKIARENEAKDYLRHLLARVE